MIKKIVRFWERFATLRSLILAVYIGIFLLVLYGPKIYRALQYKNELNICTFADLIDTELIERFEKATGIKVNCKYCELDPEMWAQLKITGGGGLDLVTPADFVASRLKQAGLLQKINKSALRQLAGCHPIFLRKDFDTGLDYCVPFAWNYYSLGYNKEFFAKHQTIPDSLQAIFEPQKAFADKPALLKDYKFAVFEDNPHELIAMGCLYLLGNDMQQLANQKVCDKVIKLFVNHKHTYLYAYVAANMRYYLTSVVPVALSFVSQFKDLIEEQPELFGTQVPKEGTVFVPQNFCIPFGAKNVAAAHKFIDFFLTNEMLLEVFYTGGYLPVKTALLEQLREEIAFSSLIPNEKEMQQFCAGALPLTLKQVEQTWLAVKTAKTKVGH